MRFSTTLETLYFNEFSAISTKITDFLGKIKVMKAKLSQFYIDGT